MNLYIIRHAIAVDEATSDYEHDSQRPLTDKGRKKMRQISKALRNLGVEFDLILSAICPAQRPPRSWPMCSS
jgi:phosphohistidine phosphatase